MNLRQAIRRLTLLARRHKLATLKGQVASEIKREAYRFGRREARRIDPFRGMRRPCPDAANKLRGMFSKMVEELNAKGYVLIPGDAKVEVLEVRKA